jgi:excisionase family DNA binding protein
MSERDRHIPDLVSKAQAAEILGVRHQAVQQMVDNGRLKGAKVGSTWVFRRVVVERMAAARVERLDADPLSGN